MPPQHSVVIAGWEMLPVAHCVTKSHGTPSSTWALQSTGRFEGTSTASTGSRIGSAKAASRERLLQFFYSVRKVPQFHVQQIIIVEQGIYLVDKNSLDGIRSERILPWEVADGWTTRQAFTAPM